MSRARFPKAQGTYTRPPKRNLLTPGGEPSTFYYQTWGGCKVSNARRFLFAALITTLGVSACGDSRSEPQPGPAPAPTPAPTPAPPAGPTPAVAIDLACGDDLTGLQLAVAGETFLASFNREFGESQLRVEAVRFTESGAVLDVPPLEIFGGDGPLRPDFRLTDLAGLESEFAIQFFGRVTSDLDVPRQEAYHRTLSTTGPLISEPQLEDSSVGFGTCRTLMGGRNAITYDLAGAMPFSAIQWSAACAGQGILLEWIDGLPWESLDPLRATSTTQGWPSLARSHNAVGGVFARAPTVRNNTSQRVLVAGWLETPVPGTASTREILSSLEEHTSEKIGLATVGETFLAAWGSAATLDSPLSELRFMRFAAGDGPLDPDGGVLLAESDAIRSPVVSGNGSEFLVVWAEPAGDAETLFLHRIAVDGAVSTEGPREISTIAAGTPFGLASTKTTVAIAYHAPDEAGNHCIRVSRP